MMSSTSKLDNISAFGHSCTLFKNPTASEWVNSKKSLMEWNGVFIDKFDVRHLLDAIDCKRRNSDDCISREELLVEIECDVERYFDLDEDKEAEGDLSLLLDPKNKYDVDDNDDTSPHQDDEINEEEEEIRKRYMGAAFSYTYGEENDDGNAAGKDQSDGKPVDGGIEMQTSAVDFPEEMALPVGMVKPVTQTQLEIILRTANFLSQQPLQMEIMLKAKQSGNANFAFLTFGDALNPFYKHIVARIRSGEYIPSPRPLVTSSRSSSPALVAAAISNVAQTHTTAVPARRIGLVDYGNNSDDSDDEGGGESDDRDPSTGGSTATEAPLLVSSHGSGSRTGIRWGTSMLAGGTSAANRTRNDDTASPAATCTRGVLDNGRETQTVSSVVVPPADMKQIADKLATYVAKNGDSFAQSVWAKSKNDTRFQFLAPNNVHHAYYLAQVAAVKATVPVPAPISTDAAQVPVSQSYNADGIVSAPASPVAVADTDDVAAKKRRRLERAKAFLTQKQLTTTCKSSTSFTSNVTSITTTSSKDTSDSTGTAASVLNGLDCEGITANKHTDGSTCAATTDTMQAHEDHSPECSDSVSIVAGGSTVSGIVDADKSTEKDTPTVHTSRAKRTPLDATGLDVTETFMEQCSSVHAVHIPGDGAEIPGDTSDYTRASEANDVAQEIQADHSIATTKKKRRIDAHDIDGDPGTTHDLPTVTEVVVKKRTSSKRSKKRGRFKFADTKEESIQPRPAPAATSAVTISTNDLLEKLKQARARR